MEILESTPERIALRLSFEKPWKATNRVLFELRGKADGATAVTWRMSGRTTGIAALFAKAVPIDRLVGRDFETGLARMKAAAERG